MFALFNRLHTIVIVISICYLTHMIFYFVFCLNSSIVCETKLIVRLLATLNRIKIKKSLLIMSYSDDCGNDHNLTSGTQYHQKNGFRNLELPIDVGYIFKFFSKYWFGHLSKVDP